ncbi:ABC transporter permease [Agrobacterium sp. NPDC090283]|uniref:ABC transporter permease n=1 Tax=Agrobacterium sp. NPDC090283 TaxID=3363920 RepID=UPI00383BE28D
MVQKRLAHLLLLPGYILLVATLLGPLVTTLVISLGNRAANGGYDPSFTLSNFAAVNSRFSAFLNTIQLSALGAAVCITIGIPVAFYIAKKLTVSRRYTALFLVVSPFFTSFVARTYAWYFALGGRGLPSIAQWLGLGQFRILNTDFAVIIGIVYAYLPIVILTLFIAFDRISDDLLEASSDLGRKPFETFFSVVIPLAMPGIISGYTLVFILLSGEYLIPMLLGGGKVYFIGNAIVDLFLQSRNWPLGSAVAVVLMLLMIAAAVLSQLAQHALNTDKRSR